MTPAHRKLIRTHYEDACNEYLIAFAQKHDFDSYYWIADRIGEIADFNEFYSVDMADIRTDIDMDAPEPEFIKWYEYCLDAIELHLTHPNFRSWLHGCPHASAEEIERLRKEKQSIIDLSSLCNDSSK